MHFDDRLATVLRARAGGPTTARIQYRQLLDLLGTMPLEAQGAQVDAACDRLGELGKTIDSTSRAAMLREPGLRLRNPRLVALLAGGEASVAAAAIGQAQLDENTWIDLAPALPASARGLVSQRRDLGPRAKALFDRLGMTAPGLPPAEATLVETQPRQRKDTEAAGKPGGIGAIVQRIEDFRRARTLGETHGGDAPHLPFGDGAIEHVRLRSRAFDFATDSEGCIVWSDPGMAPNVVGMRLTSVESIGPAAARATLVLAMRRHLPIRALGIEIAGALAIAGRWLIDATPQFDSHSGAYTGHAGRMRRPAAVAVPPAQPAPDSEADRMRQLLHELRTPVNAIQGFAEVIQQQLFGPAPHEYRALAANIAGDAAHLLAGFEELERFARLESGRIELANDNCDLAEVCRATVSQLRPFTEPRSSGFQLGCEGTGALIVTLGHQETERLIWRLLAMLAGAASPGEILSLNGKLLAGNAQLTLQLPATMAELEPEQLLLASAGTTSGTLLSGMFGTGFSLRLAMAEAKAAGGSLQQVGKVLVLTLPGLTAAPARHSEEACN